MVVDIDDGKTVIVADMVKRHIKGQRVYAVLLPNLGREDEPTSRQVVMKGNGSSSYPSSNKYRPF